MKLKEITVTRGLTYNLGDFESSRADFSVTYICDEDDVDLAEVTTKIDQEVQAIIVAEATRLKGNARGKSPRRFIEGA